MRRLLCISALAVPALAGWAKPQDIAGTNERRRFVDIEVVVGKQSRVSHKFQVPVVGPGERKVIDAAGGSWAWTGSCPEDTGCEYSIAVTADYFAEAGSKVTVALDYKGLKKCTQSKEFMVFDGKPAKYGMKCGAKVKVNFSPRARASS